MYNINDELAILADKVMEEQEDVRHLKEDGCRIIYLKCDKPKRNGNKTVYADTEKVKDKYKSVIPCDFIITFYEPNVADLSEEQMEILMWHELKHVGFEEGMCKIIPHDMEDFKDLIQKYGVDWIGA